MKWPQDAEARGRMVTALLAWVEELDREEPPPEGTDKDAGPASDLFSTVGALEAIRREVGLQGRELRRVADAGARADTRESIRGESERSAGRREVLVRLLEARDRLARSLDVARALEGAVAGGLFGTGRRRKAIGALLRGLELNVEAIDEALREFDCREIPAAARRFDSTRMRAVEAAEASEGPAGTVVDVVRTGWLAGHEVLRPAEVRAVPGAVVDSEDEEHKEAEEQ